MKKFVSAVVMTAVILSLLSMSACDDQKTPESTVSVTESTIQSSVVVSVPQESSQISWEESKTAENAITSEQMDEMTSSVSNCQYMPQFASQGSTFSAKSVANGKTITLIADDMNLSYTQLVAEQFKVAAEAAGFEKAITAKTDGSESSINTALNNAVNDKSDIIIMFGDINKDKFSTNIEYAQANGIEVISAGSINSGKNDHFTDHTMPVDYVSIGKYLADWTIIKTEGKANVLAVNCTDSALSNTIASGFKDEFEKYISGVTGYCTGVNALIGENGDKLTAKIKEVLLKDKKLNYIVVFDDRMIDSALSAVELAGVKIPVISTGGSDEAFDFARYGKIEMLIAQSYEWTAYGMVDYAMRILGNVTIPDEQYVPFRILTQEVISNAIDNFGGLGGNFNRICFGSHFEYGYNSLWQV